MRFYAIFTVKLCALKKTDRHMDKNIKLFIGKVPIIFVNI